MKWPIPSGIRLPDCGDLSSGYFKGASSRAMEQNSGWSADIRRSPTVYVAISGFRSRLTGGSRSDNIAWTSSATSASSSAPSPQNFGMQVHVCMYRMICRSHVQSLLLGDFYQEKVAISEAAGVSKLVSIGFGGSSEISSRYDSWYDDIGAKRDRLISKRREPDGQKIVD